MRAATRGASSGAPSSSKIEGDGGGAFTHAFVIKPGDEFPHVTGALYVGNGGRLTVEMASGDVVALYGIPTGSYLPIAVRRIVFEGTSASGLVGFY